MAQPPAYNRSFSFSSFQTANPTTPLPGNSVDVELSNVKITLDAMRANLALIQNDDTSVKNDTIGLAQLKDEVLVGFNTPTVWVTAHAYSHPDTVFHGAGFYRALVTHTSGTFATDLAASKWELIADLSAIPLVTAAQVAVTPSGLLTSQVQTSLEALDSGKSASSHAHPASSISDSTAAGRAVLTAANAAAQRTALGLGALAVLDSAPVLSFDTTMAIAGRTTVTLSADTADFTPSGITTSTVIDVQATTACKISGMSGGADGRVMILRHVGTANNKNITITSEDSASAAANRFTLSKPYVLRAGNAVALQYDVTSSRWRPLKGEATPPSAGSRKNARLYNVATPMGDSAPGTPNSQMIYKADSLVVEDANGETHKLFSVSVTFDGTVTNQANGTDSVSAIGNTTWYFFFVIFNPSTNTAASLISTSATAPTLPSGYTFFARVGANHTNGSAQLQRVLQIDRSASIVVSASVTTALPILGTGATGNVATPTWTAVSLTTYLPSTAYKIHGMLSSVAGTSGTAMVAPNNNYGAYSSATNPPPVVVSTATVANIGFEMLLESTNIYWAAGTADVRLVLRGWEDNI